MDPLDLAGTTCIGLAGTVVLIWLLFGERRTG